MSTITNLLIQKMNMNENVSTTFQFPHHTRNLNPTSNMVFIALEISEVVGLSSILSGSCGLGDGGIHYCC